MASKSCVHRYLCKNKILQTVLDGIDFVQNLLIKTEDLVDACPAPSLALQWSPDGLAFHDLPLKVSGLFAKNFIIRQTLK